MNRLAMNVIAVLVVLAAFWGYTQYQSEPDKQAITGEVETQKQEEGAKPAALEEARKTEENQRAEELKKAADTEQRLKAEAQKRLAAEEDRRRQEAVRKEKAEKEQLKRDEQQRQAAANEQRRRSESGGGKQAPQKQARKAEPAKPPSRSSGETSSQVSGRNVTIKTRVSAHTATQVPVARVHAGDQVTVTIKRVGKADRQLLVGLGPFIRHWMGMFPDGPLAGPRIVGKRVRDRDQFTVTHDLLAMGGARFNPDTERGAILYIGTGAIPPPPHIIPREGKRTGYYEIEIEIRGNNRWAILPESLA
jgi:hypothetical protein